MAVIKITGVESHEEIVLDRAQTFRIEGKNRIMIHDYAQLRMEPLGGKLSPLSIEGFFPLFGENKELEGEKEGLTKYHALEDFFETGARRSSALLDQFIIRVVSAPEDTITPGSTIPVGERNLDIRELNSNTVSSRNILVFRGTLKELRFDFDVENTLLINYRLSFNVYPYPNLTKKIRESYFLK